MFKIVILDPGVAYEDVNGIGCTSDLINCLPYLFFRRDIALNVFSYFFWWRSNIKIVNLTPFFSKSPDGFKADPR